jgi:4-hydroxy-tetrahydrodipicolinate reductase
MKIAIVGYGKMGHEIAKVAQTKGISAVTIDPTGENASFKEINEESMKDVDVCIDFTNPNSVVDNIKNISKFKKNIVVGTTGWYGKMDEVKEIVKSNDVGLIYASNFSLGVNIFFKIVESAAKLIDKADDYDVFGVEFHHNKKLDSPSGTAKSIGEILVKNIKRKDKLNFEKMDRKIEQDEIHFASVRGGTIPGTHVVGFDSPADIIEMKHTARNRSGFALGAVLASQWIDGKKGFFNIDDMMKEIIGG